MPENFSSIFLDNLNKKFAAVSGIISFLALLIAFNFKKIYSIELGYLVLGLAICLILISSLYSVSTNLYSKYNSKNSNERFSKIFKVIDQEGAAKDGRAKAVCLIKSSSHFLEGDLVSFYFNYREDLEHLVGIGLITNAGEKVTQIELSYVFEKHKAIVNKLIDKEEEVLDKMRIKSRIPEKDLMELRKEGK